MIIKKFLQCSDDVVDALVKTCSKIYKLESQEEVDEALKLAKEKPEEYILKPNKEGGGNNIFGEDILKKLTGATLDENRQYILMRKIIPLPRTGFMIKNKILLVEQVQSELGIWGYTLSNEKGMISSKIGSWMVRTKQFSALEGGICAGISVLDFIAFS